MAKFTYDDGGHAPMSPSGYALGTSVRQCLRLFVTIVASEVTNCCHLYHCYLFFIIIFCVRV